MRSLDPLPLPPDHSFPGLFGPKPDHDYLARVDAYPFEADASGWSTVNAWRLADVSLLAYVREAARIEEVLHAAGDPAVAVVERESTRAVVAADARTCVVAFRGTVPEDLENLRTDLRFTLDDEPGGGRVHRGFRRAFALVEDDLRAVLDRLAPGRRVWWTGHSLGGALATIGATLVAGAHGLVTFGTPRVGDAAFAARRPVPGLRVVNGSDFVPDLPPPIGYVHAGTLFWIGPDGELHRDPGLRRRLEGSWRGHEARLREAVGRWRRGERAGVVWDALVDHSPLHYAILLRNLVARGG